MPFHDVAARATLAPVRKADDLREGPGAVTGWNSGELRTLETVRGGRGLSTMARGAVKAGPTTSNRDYAAAKAGKFTLFERHNALGRVSRMSIVEDALRRLDLAMVRLEAAVTRRVEAEEARADRDIELALMDEDRARLAAELDAAGAQLARLASVTGEVERRLDRAIDTVATVLERRPPPRPGA
jgi:hypothetical protein